MRVVLLCIACFLLGGIFGIFFTALATASSYAEKREEYMRGKKNEN